MTTFYLIRHGQSDGNRYRQFDGQYNAPLTGMGKRQAAALSHRFRNIALDAVFSSDQQRAYFTAQAIALPKGLPVQPLRDFRELHNGIWEHLPWADIDRQWPGQLDLFERHMDRWLVPGAETPWETAQRYIAALERLRVRYDEQAVAVVGHADALRVTLGLMMGTPLERIGQDGLRGVNTAVTKLEWDDDGVRFVYLYDHAHLPEALLPVTAPHAEYGLSYRILAPGDPFPLEGSACCVDRGTGTWLGGYDRGTPAALLQMLPTHKSEPGRIGFYWIAPAFRGKHLGIQPIGQAVEYYRKCGVSSLQMELATEELQHYFSRFDFVRVTGTLWELPILPIPPINVFS